MQNDNQTNTPTTGQVDSGTREAAGSLVNFWQHQLKRVKERAEELQHLGGDQVEPGR